MAHEFNDTFQSSHIGPDAIERDAMLEALGAASLDTLIDQTIPAGIRLRTPMTLPPPESEAQYLRRLRQVAAKNRVARSYIGMGYYDCVTPAVILRNVFENPGWYTPYTPYQAEIAQGRLESLLNFQTMVRDLDGHGHRDRVAARRGHGRRRGDGDVPSRQHQEGASRAAERVSRIGSCLPADDRRAQGPRGTARYHARDRRCRLAADGSRVRPARSVSG